MIRSLIVTNSLLIAFISFLFIYGCSASTGSRYEKEKTTNTTETKNGDTKSYNLKEDFDITPYKTEIVIPEKKSSGISEKENVWFDYGSPEIGTKTKTLIGTGDGFRVLVLTTDNIEEANQIKADVYFSQNTNEVYIDFEPPFYKVKLGDFDTQKIADDLRFKLNQLGYKEAKVVKDKINIYQ